MPLEIVPRDKWGALPPTDRRENPPYPVANVCIWFIRTMESCHTDEDCERNMREQQARDMEKDMSDIKYSFIIGGNGKTYEGRGWEYQSSQRLPYAQMHGNRVDIGHFGQYETFEDLPFAMQDAQEQLIKYGVDHDLIAERYKLTDKNL